MHSTNQFKEGIFLIKHTYNQKFNPNLALIHNLPISYLWVATNDSRRSWTSDYYPIALPSSEPNYNIFKIIALNIIFSHNIKENARKDLSFLPQCFSSISALNYSTHHPKTQNTPMKFQNWVTKRNYFLSTHIHAEWVPNSEFTKQLTCSPCYQIGLPRITARNPGISNRKFRPPMILSWPRGTPQHAQRKSGDSRKNFAHETMEQSTRNIKNRGPENSITNH